MTRPPPSSMARQRIVAEERERAVRAYRAAKKLQRQSQAEAHRPPRKKPETCL